MLRRMKKKEKEKMKLPIIEEKHIILRPGIKNWGGDYWVPNPDHKVFWNEFYKEMRSNYKFIEPLADSESKIEPHFGYFGFRWEPEDMTKNAFHTGIDIVTQLSQRYLENRIPTVGGEFVFSTLTKPEGAKY
jgi:hypothetical protein